ncbi:MAG: nucleotidyl transferase AbiEii/AbiGii toxin family protein [Opitutaceae bacterium]
MKALNDAGVRYIVVGGVAVIAHGYVRFTQDLDLVVSLDDANVKLAMETLEKQGFRPKVPVNAIDFADPAKRESWIREKHMLVFQMISGRHPSVAIDIFSSEPFPFDREWESLSRMQVAPSIEAPIVTLSTLLELKRAANRPSDRIDIQMLTRARDPSSSHE